jgi:acetyltransferase-like isoleucine patch superfamily enzyme
MVVIIWGVSVKTYRNNVKNIFIKAKEIEVGKDVSFGGDIHVDVKGVFRIGDRSRLGHGVNIAGRDIIIGTDLYHSAGLIIGGGGCTNPTSNFTIGDRCTIHNNYINLAEPVLIGDDVGLSLEVSIQTHGYWLSVLEGFPAKFAGVTIDSGTIVGYGSTILMGVHIYENVVIGASSVVTKDLDRPNGIYVGNPAKFIKEVEPLPQEERKDVVNKIITKYIGIAHYHGIKPIIKIDYPHIYVNSCKFDVEKLEFTGKEDEETDDFRDYVRKWGLRFYSGRPFKCIY